jgi:hypothetical protein
MTRLSRLRMAVPRVSSTNTHVMRRRGGIVTVCGRRGGLMHVTPSESCISHQMVIKHMDKTLPWELRLGSNRRTGSNRLAHLPSDRPTIGGEMPPPLRSPSNDVRPRGHGPRGHGPRGHATHHLRIAHHTPSTFRQERHAR